MWIDSWQCLLLNCMKKIASVGRGTWKKWEKWKGQTKKVVRMVEMHVGGHQRRPCGGRPEKLAPIRADHAAAPSSMYKYMYWAERAWMRWSVYNPRLFTAVGLDPLLLLLITTSLCKVVAAGCNEKIHQTRTAPPIRLFADSFPLRGKSPFLLLWTFSNEIPCPTTDWCRCPRADIKGLINPRVDCDRPSAQGCPAFYLLQLQYHHISRGVLWL